MSFLNILNKHRQLAFSERDKGERFERLMQAYLLTDPQYSSQFKKVWLWDEFIGRNDLGGNDTGIDLVAVTHWGDYWAIQCKCYKEGTLIDKPAVDSFLSTSSRKFRNEELQTVGFAHRLWIDTTGHRWGSNAEEAIKNQHPPVTRLSLHNLVDAPVDWEKLDNNIFGAEAVKPKKKLRAHQSLAMEKTNSHFEVADRGKLIMACGTGKTFTSLRIAENQTDGQGLVLFLVPSIALLGQTLREWSADAKEKINAICICSDPKITKKKIENEEFDYGNTVDLAWPASTDTTEIIKQFQHYKYNGSEGMTVVFSTYQSIEVIARAQKELAKVDPAWGEFDLIICDEAHRTTGVTLAAEDSSAFVKVHENDFIKSKKRLYMTATPRLYDNNTKSKAAQADAVLCSMDDVNLYGEEIYRIGFGEAVEKNLLTDYKVLVLTLSDKDVPPAVQKMIQDEKSEINADDASKLIGCINALSKKFLGDMGIAKAEDPEPMRRAVAFCANISVSKKITSTFNTATEAYIDSLPAEHKAQMVSVASRHVDGTMAAPERDSLLAWLKADSKDNECRILTNVRCLSEGVDVPSLDAVLFLSARNSQVDVVQSVGRVMRRAEGKNYGYIIIPVIIPSDVDASLALDDNERYKVVWTVLNALRAHDDRFNATVNKIELNRKRPTQILVGRPEVSFDENGRPYTADSGDSQQTTSEISRQLAIQFEQLQSVVFAKMVEKVGDRRYWEQWAKSVAEIAQRQVERIKKLIAEDGTHQQAFENFLAGLRKNINPSITKEEAIDMLSQHIITKPVFEALFEGYSFVKNNPISVSMQSMLDLLEEQAIEKDTETLQKFYDSVKMRAKGIDNAEGKQRIIIELYDKFFKTAFPKMVEKLGIVYTPVEVVDFIIHSVNDVLKQEFGRSLSDENVHILDPFTGTGTFVTRLLQSGLIDKIDLPRKYAHEIHANEIVLLAYYIAAVNIENAYHDAIGGEDYKAFDGICLTDTFQLGESDGSDKLAFKDMFPQNSERVTRQKKAPLTVIMGNPPYSVGQKSVNDNAQNQSYLNLEGRIERTYVKNSSSNNVKAIYDSYFKAFRWSTDRLDKNGGIICFVSNGAWLDGNSADGFRKTLEKEFTSVWVFNLRGNQRTSGELSRKEGGKIFGSGSRTPITITLLVKNPKVKTDRAAVYYHDIGDYLSREDKLAIVDRFKKEGILQMPWQTLAPNEYGDWISIRNNMFDTFVSVNAEKKLNAKSQSYFIINCFGLTTNRDAFVYNFSAVTLKQKVKALIEFYNSQLSNIGKNEEPQVDKQVISWSRGLKDNLYRNKILTYKSDSIVNSLYRPFCKQQSYFNSDLNEYVYQLPKFFPLPQSKNIAICITGTGGSKEFAPLIADVIPNLHLVENGQYFPLYYYEENPSTQIGLFDNPEAKYTRRDAISDFILKRAQEQYGKVVTKEDIFYYVYGFLHSPKYRETFANDLKKMLPRLPLVDEPKDFWAFSKAGRKLADLHINYESVPKHPETIVVVDRLPISDALNQADKDELEYVNYRVQKMRFPKKGQKDSIIYNSQITIDNIPEKAYEYVVNGKSAIEWIMERYAVTTHKESGITNDPNDWAKEHGKPRYILDLLLSIINVSVQTVDIVAGLPKVKFDESASKTVAEEI